MNERKIIKVINNLYYVYLTDKIIVLYFYKVYKKMYWTAFVLEGIYGSIEIL